MRDFSYILVFTTFLIGMFTDNLTLLISSIFLLLQLIFFELKKLNDK